MGSYSDLFLSKVHLTNHQTETRFIINTKHISNPKAYSQ
jgi:hypothetical protein